MSLGFDSKLWICAVLFGAVFSQSKLGVHVCMHDEFGSYRANSTGPILQNCTQPLAFEAHLFEIFISLYYYGSRLQVF